MSREYPRYAGKIRLSDKARAKPPRCAACLCDAIGYADVQFGWSRSDDWPYPVCEEHRKTASRDVKLFLRIMECQKPAPTVGDVGAG